MTKREVVWLIIRLAGLYFLWQAVESAVCFVTSAGIVNGPSGVAGDSSQVLLLMLFKAALYSALGFYCVRDGKFFFDVLSRE